MTDRVMDGVDDSLAIGADLVDILVQIKNPAERLLRRRDVVAVGAKYDDGRADIAQVDCRSIRYADVAGGEIVADEQFVDNELNLFRIQIYLATPPALKAEIAGGFGVDCRIQIVLLGQKCICRILIFEILYEPGAVELAAPQITRQCREPAAAKQPTR